MKMRKTILYIILTLAVPALISMPAGAQDSRQRTVLTIVQDALAQLPVQNAARRYYSFLLYCALH